MDKPRESSAPSLSHQRIIWFSFLSSLVIYGVVAYFMFGDQAGTDAVTPGMLWVITALLAMGSLLVPRLGIARYLRKLLGWALAEAIGIMGLVGVVLGSVSQQGLYPFLGIAFVLILVQFPRD